MPKRQAQHASDGDEAAGERPRGDFFAFKNSRQRQHDDGRRGDDGGNNAGGRVFERPLHATHANRLAGQAVDQDPRPELEFFTRGKGIQHLRIITVPAGMPPFHNQENQAERDGAADDTLVASRAGVGMFARRVRNEVGFAAQHRAERAAERGNGAGEQASPQPARGDFQMVARRERDDHPGENHGHANNFREVQPGAEPEPFDQHGEQRGEALGEQNRPAAAEARQRLIISGVAEADAGQSAQDKNGERPAVRARAERICPNRQEKHGADNAPEICLHAAQPRRGAMAANGGDGKQQRGEQRGEHVGCKRKIFDAANSAWPSRPADEQLKLLVMLVRGKAISGFNLPAAFMEDFGDVRRNPVLVFAFSGNRFDAVVALTVTFQNAAFRHPRQDHLGPVGVLVKPFFGGGTPGNLHCADVLGSPSFEKLKNFALVTVHDTKLAVYRVRVEELNRPHNQFALQLIMNHGRRCEKALAGFAMFALRFTCHSPIQARRVNRISQIQNTGPRCPGCRKRLNFNALFFLFPFSIHLHFSGMELSVAEIRRAVQAALAEDIGSGDATTLAIVPKTAMAKAVMRAREPLVVAGLDFAEAAFCEVFSFVDRRGELCKPQKSQNKLGRRGTPPSEGKIKIGRLAADGRRVKAGANLLKISGPARAILSAERVALNFIQRLSGIATLTAQFVDAIKNTPAQILDTRKTTPGWRRFEKYAVTCGGGKNHRLGLFDLVLIKDNHLAALRGAKPNAIAAAVRRAREKFPQLKIEVEADTLEQAKQAAEAGADIILLDNMNPVQLRLAVQKIKGRAKTEASGGVNLGNVHTIAKTSVDFISIGALTHSARAVDIGLDFEN